MEMARVTPRLNDMHLTNFRLVFKHSLNAYRFAHSPCEVFCFVDVGSGKCDIKMLSRTLKEVKLAGGVSNDETKTVYLLQEFL